MSRSRILNRIRTVTRESGAPALPESTPAQAEFANPVEEFVRQAELIDARIYRASDQDALAEVLAKILQEASLEELFWESPEIFEKHRIPFRFRDPAGFGDGKLMASFHFRKKVEFPLAVNTKPFKRASLPAIDLVVLHAEWGVAETGSLGLQVRPGKGRILSVLPPRIVVMVRARDIASNLQQILENDRTAQEGSILTLFSGPSRTADIEKTLVIGVHGPKEVFVVITDVAQSEALAGRESCLNSCL